MEDANETSHTMIEDQANPELPRARRTRVLKKGRIIFQRGLRSIPCIVRDLSDGGAKLQFENAFMLPKQFDLHIDLEDFEVTCERRWEEGLTCGVQFVGEKRYVNRQRAQVLKTSEDALKTELDELTDARDDFFTRNRDRSSDPMPQQPVRRTRPSGGAGKPTFGKRR